MEHFDIVIVGAGLHGLAIARALVHAGSNRSRKLIILDEGCSIGGTWAAERLYSGLKTNNVVGSYEFSDFPMELERYGLEPGQHIPGSVVHRYLTDFAVHFGLDKLVRHQTKVEAASLQEDGTWELDCKYLCEGQAQTRKLVCDKLVIATGLTSEARMPTFYGDSHFRGPLFHAKDFPKRSQDLKGCEEVVVVGGNKSAWDVCYSVATAGACAHMVIRPTGGGPSWVWRPIYLLGMKFTLARLSSTRLFSWFDPSPLGSSFSSVRRFLQGTLLGTWLLWLFWAALDFFAAAATGYRDRRLRMLKPWISTFWMGNSLSIHNYETDWFELVRKGRIVVHHARIVRMAETAVHISGNSDSCCLRADAVVCCTGWNCAPQITFKPNRIVKEIGLPQDYEIYRPQYQTAQDRREQETQSWIRKEIMMRYPQLGFPPRRIIPKDDGTWGEGWMIDSMLDPDLYHLDKPPRHSAQRVPCRLYRFLVPTAPRFLRFRNIAFIGMHRSIHATIVAQAQALWITAFFDERLPVELEPGAIQHETMWQTEYQKVRRPRVSGGSGDLFPDLVFDSIPYTDLLLEDLGLPTMRKRSLWANITQPHLPADYKTRR
ncbi:FAD/NAD(P)-binding domain-containing protein [Nemania sp. FL0031]|nr:FAD/NAD(P)-binding domain-containing protein [Nemania sp. FL0031]